MKNQLKFRLSLLFYSCLIFASGQTKGDLNPGKDRWNIKTSAENFTTNENAKPVALNELLTRPLLDKKFSGKDYDKVLIPETVDGLKEGDIISTTGYLHLVALEKASNGRDGDYHIQITLNPEWGDSCFIVEIPLDTLTFVSNAALRSICQKNRSFIRKEVLNNENKDPSIPGSILHPAVYVKVTGQLFYDAIHAGAMRSKNPKYRGKKSSSPTSMHSYTAWEIHPVTNIEFAPKP